VAVTPNAADRPGALRATVLAGLCAVLTALGHLAGGGIAPDLTVLVVLLPLLAGVFTTLAARARTGLGTVAVLGLGQLALHQLVELLNPTHPAHATHHVAGTDLPAGAGMVAAHAVATLITAAALRYADRALDWVRAALRRVVLRRPPVLCADRPLATLATAEPAVALRLARALAGAQVRRGPPVGC
jgi:hypothetical protein